MVGALWLLGGNPVLLAEIKRRELRGEGQVVNQRVVRLPTGSRRGFRIRTWRLRMSLAV